MTIDWTHFTPWTSLAGGTVIGLAAGGLLGKNAPSELWWRIAFLFGLLAAPWLWRTAQSLPMSQIDASHATLIVAGLLVGLGTRYGSGCTSGHGVCGISRGSMRSLIATLLFMGAGFASVFLLRHVFS